MNAFSRVMFLSKFGMHVDDGCSSSPAVECFRTVKLFVKLVVLFYSILTLFVSFNGELNV